MVARRRRIKFIKMHAGGNDFVIFDNREKRLPSDFKTLAQTVCPRKYGIGADGILILKNSSKQNFYMQYYNADGSRASMCGNGGRCIAYFSYRIGAAPREMSFETDAGVYQARILDSTVKLFMRPPAHINTDIAVTVKNKKIRCHSIHTGVPHVVIFAQRIESVNVNEIGRIVRFHQLFKPGGTNVNFVKKKNTHTLIVRTYERGVEAETNACGTGVTASTLIAALKGYVKQPVDCITTGGGVLTVSFDQNRFAQDKVFENICLEGPVHISFEGEVYL